ncbi:uncharacterized protein LOC112571304 isoform X2 [Pomacea canaliculata]|uniref:uncharacterized protein LOC112571304 isoform X2 n=1 Tax=Pomacea canaliculata TaxID=400727 RepID=UPI000D73B884|nr:uncharacterized protein LOC112571304 isoform X2 [Pomacea canaliculata]
MDVGWKRGKLSIGRTSSILKRALADIDINSKEEKENQKRRRSSKRVSFAETYVVKEFARDSPQVCKDEHYVADSSGDVISVPFSGETANGQRPNDSSWAHVESDSVFVPEDSETTFINGMIHSKDFPCESTRILDCSILTPAIQVASDSRLLSSGTRMTGPGNKGISAAFADFVPSLNNEGISSDFVPSVGSTCKQHNIGLSSAMCAVERGVAGDDIETRFCDGTEPKNISTKGSGDNKTMMFEEDYMELTMETSQTEDISPVAGGNIPKLSAKDFLTRVLGVSATMPYAAKDKTIISKTVNSNTTEMACNLVEPEPRDIVGLVSRRPAGGEYRTKPIVNEVTTTGKEETVLFSHSDPEADMDLTQDSLNIYPPISLPRTKDFADKVKSISTDKEETVVFGHSDPEAEMDLTQENLTMSHSHYLPALCKPSAKAFLSALKGSSSERESNIPVINKNQVEIACSLSPQEGSSGKCLHTLSPDTTSINHMHLQDIRQRINERNQGTKLEMKEVTFIGHAEPEDVTWESQDCFSEQPKTALFKPSAKTFLAALQAPLTKPIATLDQTLYTCLTSDSCKTSSEERSFVVVPDGAQPPVDQWSSNGLTLLSVQLPSHVVSKTLPHSSSPSHAQSPAEGQPAPPSAEGQPAPPRAEGQPAPPIAEGQPAPPIAEGQPALPRAEGQPAPPIAEGQPAPPSAEGQPALQRAERQPAPMRAEGQPALLSAEAEASIKVDLQLGTDNDILVPTEHSHCSRIKGFQVASLVYKPQTNVSNARVGSSISQYCVSSAREESTASQPGVPSAKEESIAPQSTVSATEDSNILLSFVSNDKGVTSTYQPVVSSYSNERNLSMIKLTKCDDSKRILCSGILPLATQANMLAVSSECSAAEKMQITTCKMNTNSQVDSLPNIHQLSVPAARGQISLGNSKHGPASPVNNAAVTMELTENVMWSQLSSLPQANLSVNDITPHVENKTLLFDTAETRAAMSFTCNLPMAADSQTENKTLLFDAAETKGAMSFTSNLSSPAHLLISDVNDAQTENKTVLFDLAETRAAMSFTCHLSDNSRISSRSMNLSATANEGSTACSNHDVTLKLQETKGNFTASDIGKSDSLIMESCSHASKARSGTSVELLGTLKLAQLHEYLPLAQSLSCTFVTDVNIEKKTIQAAQLSPSRPDANRSGNILVVNSVIQPLSDVGDIDGQTLLRGYPLSPKSVMQQDISCIGHSHILQDCTSPKNSVIESPGISIVIPPEKIEKDTTPAFHSNSITSRKYCDIFAETLPDVSQHHGELDASQRSNPVLSYSLTAGLQNNTAMSVSLGRSFLDRKDVPGSVEEFCSRLGVEPFILQHPALRRSSIVKSEVKCETLEEELNIALMMQPQCMARQEQLNTIESTTKRMAKQKLELERQVLPIIPALISDSEQQMEIIKQEVQGLLGACRRQTQAAWKRCKAEMFHKEAQKIREEYKAVCTQMDDMTSCTEMMVDMSRSVKRYIGNIQAHLQGLSAAAEQPADKYGQELHEQQQLCQTDLAKLEKQLNKTTGLITTLHQQLDELQHQEEQAAGQESARLERKHQLTGLVDKIYILHKLHTWRPLHMQENHIKLLLLYDSVLLNIVFQEQPSVQRLITSISATSRLSGSQPWAMLASHLLTETIRMSTRLLMSVAPSCQHMWQLLEMISNMTEDAKSLCEEVKLASFSYLLTISGTSIKVELWSVRNVCKVCLTTQMPVGHSPAKALTWKAAVIMGNFSESEIEGVIQRVRAGPCHMTRVLNAVQALLSS